MDSEYEEVLANQISTLVVSEYNKLPPKGKPVTRSNGIKEWTVLSGIVAIISNSTEHELYPISISTGVKSTPFEILSNFSNGLILHDLHAEILSIRSLNWFLISECLKIEKEEAYESKIIERIEDVNEDAKGSFKFKLRSCVMFGMFISEPPCGDGSMLYLQANSIDTKPWDDEDNVNHKKRKIDSIQRGRSNFDKLGIIRSKPGRADSLVSLSKSCSDKLCLKQLTSLLNSVSSTILDPHGMYLSYLILENGRFDPDDIKRCFHERFSSKCSETVNQDYKINPMKILACNALEEYIFHKEDGKQPSNMCLVHIAATHKKTELINNGVKNGCFAKNKPIKKNSESILCCKSLFHFCRPLLDLGDIKSYQGLKKQNKCRNSIKIEGRKVLGEWIKNYEEDFEIQ